MADDRQQAFVVFTDGAAKGNPGPGGWGVVIVTPDGRVRELGGGAPHTTNNRMELTGPIEALLYLKPAPGPVAVYTDSTYVIRGIREWIPAWERRGWKTVDGKDVLNRELWERLWHLVQGRGSRQVKWHYVRGHSGIPGNERVDQIATAFAVKNHPDLYEGPLHSYFVDILEIPNDTTLPSSSTKPASSSGGKTAYSYVSLVDGVPMRHATWKDCEQRVKGRSGAKFKKASSREDEASIFRDWGVTGKMGS
jgi:ribonuclease HI